MNEACPSIAAVLHRGVRRRCPRCGRGEVFRKWFTLHDRCGVCGYVLQEKPGDTWGFWIVGDRIFVFIPLVLLYFGVAPLDWRLRLFFFGIVAAGFIATMPHRLAICIGLDYYSRARLGDSAADVPQRSAPDQSKETGSK